MTSFIRLLATLAWMLYWVQYSGKAAGTSSIPPTNVPVGTVFAVTNDPYVMQSSSGLFWLEFKQWVASDDITYCMAGVAYAKKNPGRVMWSFTREPVLAGSACRLNLSNDGVLSFEHNGGVIAWQSNTPAGSGAHLTLTDEGNLILQDQANQTIWQSFDESSYFIFPSGMMFSKNQTIHQRDLIAESGSDFSIPPGNFSAKLSQSGDRLLLVSTHGNESLFVYHSLAAPNVAGAQFVMLGDTGIDFYANKGSAPLGTIASNLGSLPPVGTLIKSGGFFHAPDGNFIVNYWNGSKFLDYYNSSIKQCEKPLQCGEYGLCKQATGACSCPAGFRKDGTNCKGTDATQSLAPIPVVFHPQLSPLSVKSQDDCKTRCDKDPTCNAALFDSTSLSCSLFPILYTVMEGHNNSQLMFLKIPSSHHKNQAEAAIIGMAVGIFGFVFLTCAGLALCFFSRRRRLRRNTLDHDELYLQELPRLPHRFSYNDLLVATEDFSRRLGQGGFGTVYEGVLVSNGRKVAVKRLEQGSTAGAHSMDQFKMEVATIGSISHRNLVVLKGFCMEEGARLLVYEFMERGSLERWLFKPKEEAELGAKEGCVLDWERRCQIALDTARGLEYLHHQCAETIVHCDVKPENILLGENFNAKVADFGLAKLICADTQSFVMSTLKGTRGYLAPEWLQHAKITAKSDVYSYGVVLLELISGRRCLEAEHDYLPTWAWSVAMSSASTTSSSSTSTTSSSSTSTSGISSVSSCHMGSIDTRRVENVLLDERLRGDVAGHSLERMLLIALACVNAEPSVRPSMASVVQVLEGHVDVAPLVSSSTNATGSTR